MANWPPCAMTAGRCCSSNSRLMALPSGRHLSSRLRVPKLFDLHADPFERAEYEGIDYSHWRLDRVYLIVPAQPMSGSG